MRILIIRPGAIGDTLLAFPIIEALRTRHTASHVTLVGNARVLPLASICGVVDEVFSYEMTVWSELFADGGIHSPGLHDLLARTTVIICWLRDPEGVVAHNLRSAGNRHFTIVPGRPPEGERIHEVDYLARTVGVELNTPPYVLALPAQAAIASESNNAQAPVAIHPGSGGMAKCWPTRAFADIIQHLWQRGTPVLLLHGPADDERRQDLCSLLPPPPQPDLLETLHNVPLVSLAQHLRRCRGYLGNDSGITHLASQVGVPTIALFGPSDPCIWRPIGPMVKVIYKPQLEQLMSSFVFSTMEAFFL